MSKKEREEKIKAFWAYFEPTQGTIKCTREFFANDDCPVVESMLVNAQ